MPIYEYRCENCGHQQEFLQKVSDAPLTVCPNCGQATFTKMVTAAGFQLKGSGWYVTDFKGGGKPATKSGETEGSKPAAPAEQKPDGKSDAKSESKSESTAASPATPTPSSS